MDAERLLSWYAETDLLKVLDHAGRNGGDISFEAARIACRRAGEKVRELEEQLRAYDCVSRRLFTNGHVY